MAGGAKVFGTVVTLESDSACITFVAVIVLLLALEHVIHHVEEVAKHSGYEGIFNKVNKEMMILGLVSFTTFVMFEATNVSTDSVWYHAFHFSHFVMLFIALAFVFQALFLSKFISIQRERLYRLFYVTESKLVSKYEFMMNYANNSLHPKFMWLMYTLFFEAPYSFPYPALRDAMEYKIIEEHFVRTFLLPEQFNFAEYMSTRFQSHVFALVDVQPASWAVLVLGIIANYGRIKVIDPVFQEEVCKEFEDYHGDDHHDDDHHDDNGGPARKLFLHRILAAASPACEQYTLRVAFVYAVFLSLFIFMVYQVSNFYYRRHLQHAVRAVAEPVQFRCEQHVPFRPEFDDDADFKKTGHRYRSFYKTCLMNIAAIKSHERSINTVRILKKMRELEHQVEQEQLEEARAAAEEEENAAAAASGVAKPIRDQGGFQNDVFVIDSEASIPTRDVPISSAATMGGDTKSHYSSADKANGTASRTEPVAPLTISVSDAARAAEAEDSFDCSPAPLMPGVAPMLRIDSETIDGSRGHSLREGMQHENSWAPPPTDGRGMYGRDISWSARNRENSWAPPPTDGRSRSRTRSMSKLDSNFAQMHRIPTSGPEIAGGSGRHSLRSRMPSFSANHPEDEGIQMSRGAGNTSLGGRSRSLTAHLQGDFHELERFDNSVSRGQSLQAFYAHVSQHLNNSKHDGHGSKVGATPVSKGARRRKTELVTIDGTGQGKKAEPSTHVVLSELKLENDTSHIFLWRSQWVYRFSVELSLLLQCFYMAVWATNLIVVAADAEYFPVQWAVGLTFPMLLNFWMLRSILFLSCTLEAVSVLNVKDSGLVCERIMQKEDALDKFRSAVRRKLLENHSLAPSDRRKYIREQLKELDYVNENDESDTSQDTTHYRITYDQFEVFLEELGIEMPDSEFDLLCHVLDDQKTNISGDKGALNIMQSTGLLEDDSISILHIYAVLFPEVHFLLDSHNQKLSSSQMAEESLDLYDKSTVNERQLFRRDEAKRQKALKKALKKSKQSSEVEACAAPWYHFEGLQRSVRNFFEPPKSFADDIEIVDEEQAGSSEYVRTTNVQGEHVFNELETVIDEESGAIHIKRMHSKANIMGEEMFARNKNERSRSTRKLGKRPSMTDEIEMVMDGSVFGFAAGDAAEDEAAAVAAAAEGQKGRDVEAGLTTPKPNASFRPKLSRSGSESAGDYEYALTIDSHAKNVGISKLGSLSKGSSFRGSV